MKTLRHKLGKGMSHFITYNRLPTILPDLLGHLTTAAECGIEVKGPSLYEVSEAYLEEEYSK